MTQQAESLPQSHFAVQLVGPGRLTLNTSKSTFRPGPHQLVVRVEAVGLCFSDLKLLKQFSAHPRKGRVVSGLSAEVLDEIPSYVPEDQPVVPGHEVACRIVAVGSEVRRHQVGERCLVQTDYRHLTTNGSNSAFGYNFEGGLQEYVLLDERVIIDPVSEERFLIRVPEGLSASAVALVEPWACVEDAYATVDRRTIRSGGRLLVVADAGRAVSGLGAAFGAGGPPAAVTALTASDDQLSAIRELAVPTTTALTAAALENEFFDDIVYFGAGADTIEALNDKLAPQGLFNLVLGGQTIGRLVSVGIGRVHYGMTRWIGTTGENAAESYDTVPASGELRAADRVVVIGAGGPMGQMHVIRAVCSDVAGIAVVGTDMDDARLDSLRRKAHDLALKNSIPLRLVNTAKEQLHERFNHYVILVPAGALVAAAVRECDNRGLIDIFAGIPAATKQDLDLDAYVAKRLYLFGTSGSEIRDMKIMLGRVERGQLDTNCSVDAVSGMAGAMDGLAAVENRTLAGKIIVYPALHDLELLPLSSLPSRFPTVAERLDHGQWSLEAEQELLRVAGARQ